MKKDYDVEMNRLLGEVHKRGDAPGYQSVTIALCLLFVASSILLVPSSCIVSEAMTDSWRTRKRSFIHVWSLSILMVMIL